MAKKTKQPGPDDHRVQMLFKLDPAFGEMYRRRANLHSTSLVETLRDLLLDDVYVTITKAIKTGVLLQQELIDVHADARQDGWPAMFAGYGKLLATIQERVPDFAIARRNQEQTKAEAHAALSDLLKAVGPLHGFEPDDFLRNLTMQLAVGHVHVAIEKGILTDVEVAATTKRYMRDEPTNARLYEALADLCRRIADRSPNYATEVTRQMMGGNEFPNRQFVDDAGRTFGLQPE